MRHTVQSVCYRSCQNVHARQTSVLHSPVFPCYADVPEDAEEEADVEVATGSVIEAGAQWGVEGDVVGVQGHVVSVQGCGDSTAQSSTTRQQVCSFLDSLLSASGQKVIMCTSNCISRLTAQAVVLLAPCL